MGGRSGVKTALDLFVAFQHQRVWKQADLARSLQVGPKTVRRWLLDMCEAGVPLIFEDDDPPHVYWSMPRHWYPQGTLLPPELLQQTYQQVARAPESPARNQVLDRLQRLHGNSDALGWASGILSEQEERALTVIEQAQRAERAVILSYVSSRSGQGTRVVSIHHVAPGLPVRFLAFDHQAQATRWFRLDSVLSAELHSDPADLRDADEIGRLIAESVDGFHDGKPPIEHRFFVQFPDSLWVKKSLLAPMVATQTDGGIIVSATVAGVTQIARFVVGLGAVARPLTDELRGEVRRLASGALERLTQTDSPECVRSGK